MDIARTRVLDVVLDDKSWLASAKGTDTTDSITIDPSKGFVLATHYPSGYLKSGLPLGLMTSGGSSGMYGLYDDAATDGRQTCVGFLYGHIKVNAANPTTVKLGGALLWEGEVRLPRIQAILGVALDANGQADLAAKFRFLNS